MQPLHSAVLKDVVETTWRTRLPEGVRELQVWEDASGIVVVAVPQRITGRWAYVLQGGASWGLDVLVDFERLDRAAEQAVSMCWFESSYAA